jgi:putative ABC transport system permease protein
MKLFDAARTRLRLILGGSAAELRADKEFQFHIEMEADRLVREQGLALGEARRRAMAAFGGVDKYKEALRDGRGTAWLTGLSLDLKLGMRTLAKYPGVSIVGGLAMAIGVGLGAAYFEIVGDLLRPRLPFAEGERIVGLRNWDVAENDPELRSISDFAVWRSHLRSVQDVGAFRSIQRNVGPADAAGEPAHGAEITPSAFRVVRVPALHGRTLIDADEQPGAPPAVVLGYDLWRNRFAGNPTVVGQTIRIGQTPVTAVGVMPEGFGFPVDQQFWIPLRVNATAYGRREGPAIQVFGRLAPGATVDTAQAELDAIGVRAAAEFPTTHQHLRPRIMKYTELFIGGEASGQAYLVQFVFVALLLVLSSNVATMLFARMATREHEIAMRFALGAGRGRVLGQFFLEALVLAIGATVVGLLLVARSADWITRLFWDITEGRIPFWLESGVTLNATTIVFALLLAVVAALVAGVVPALKATRSGLQAQLRHAPGAAASSLRFGGLWSAMIVIQVTFAVIVVPPAIVAVSGLAKGDHADAGFPEDEYMSARLALELEQPTGGAAARPDLFPQFQTAMDEMRRRLLADGAISQVTFASRIPGMSHPDPAVEVAADGDAPARFANWALASAVAVDYFDTFGAGIVAGRAFNSGDLRSDANVVVVNQHFVDDVLDGRNAVGRRVRYRTRWEQRSATGSPAVRSPAEMREPGDWFEIVGVVENLGMDTTMDAFFPGKGPGIYHPLTREAMGSPGFYSVRMAFHVRGDPASFAPRLREVAHAVDPALSVHETIPLDRAVDKTSQSQRRLGRLAAWIAALVALIALLVSVAGIYSVLSFTVARQTHDIGIRIALGADRRGIVARVFSRAMIQIATGLLLGAVVWFYVIVRVLGGGDSVWLLMTTAAVLLLVGVLACGVPVRRALRIEPLEAIRTVG